MTTRIHPPDAPPPPDDEQLPCGRLLSDVWADWEDGVTDPHRDTCPHCREAVAELERLETAVGRLREATEDEDGYDAASLTERVMDVVRLELRPGRPLPLGGPEEDSWVMESVAARALRAAAEEVPGVRAGSCRIEPVPGADTSRVTVTLGVHVPLTTAHLPELADRIRARVRRAADAGIGLDVVGVDVHVTDFTDAADDRQEGTGR
ncbi:Asp23/Gls24 family envelope stress response protein [Streptomyces sp. NPDC001941]|uniref:Asp23/Gls24 family envelope stress response protein n=1 Tax=Streptomyces sp. NPDC001941 TaxID=3154659 RepID=UPI0033225DDF